MGFSMGGRGTYAIGLKNPDVFAAIAPLAPLADTYEDYYRRPEPVECKAGIVGGNPGDSDRVDTMYSITSGRFLIENAYNLPIFHAHGIRDGITFNVPGGNSYLHGFHITTDNSFSGCHGDSDLCFGHTPTLQELSDSFNDGYDWAYMFTDVSHVVDDAWVDGTNNRSPNQGVSVPGGQLLGMMDYLEEKSLQSSPSTVVYKTYTDTHSKAYWLELLSAVPWTDTPAAVRARRNQQDNSLALELARAESLIINLSAAGLNVVSSLNITLAELMELNFDPALMLQPDESYLTTIALQGEFSAEDITSILLNGESPESALISITDGEVTIGPIDPSAAATIEIN
jgi:hypothetical protein